MIFALKKNNMLLGHDGGCCRGGIYGNKAAIGEKCTETHSCQGDRYECQMIITNVDDEYITCTVTGYKALDCTDSVLSSYAIKNY